jgi:hypothetical protein
MVRSIARTALVILLGTSGAAAESNFPCPEPTAQVGTDIKADLNGQAQALLKVGSAELKGKVEKTVVDLFSKYPNADRVAIVQNMLGTACNIIRTSTQLSDVQKFDMWMAVFPAVQQYLGPEKKP